MNEREQLARLLRGLNEGRAKAHANRRAEREEKDQRMQIHFRSCRAAGWVDDQILNAYAARYKIQRDTARRRAKRLNLLANAQFESDVRRRCAAAQ